VNISAKPNFSTRLAETFTLLSGCWRRRAVATAILAPAIALGAPHALADESGNGYRLPGLDGSFAAVPQPPGWGFAAVYIHFSDGANGSLETTLGDKITLGLKALAETALLVPSYTAHDPILGGQLQLSMGSVVLEGLNVNVTHASINGTQLGPESGSLVAPGELYPAAQLRWNFGVNNFMLFADGGIPVGSYDPSRLANTGKNTFAIDGGAGYTYFDKNTGHEFTGVIGISNNWPNPATDYRNGNTVHLDWGASQHLSEDFFVGAVGYVYDQITPDTGAGAILGPNLSRAASIGPQVGFTNVLGLKGSFLGVKGYYDFYAQRRLNGWNTWLTLSLALGG